MYFSYQSDINMHIYSECVTLWCYKFLKRKFKQEINLYKDCAYFWRVQMLSFKILKISRKCVITSDILFSFLNREFSSRELFPHKIQYVKIVKMSSIIISKKIFPIYCSPCELRIQPLVRIPSQCGVTFWGCLLGKRLGKVKIGS